MINLQDYVLVKDDDVITFTSKKYGGLWLSVLEKDVPYIINLIGNAKLIAVTDYDAKKERFSGMSIRTSDNVLAPTVIRVQFDDMKSILFQNECIKLKTIMAGLVAKNCPEIGKMTPIYDVSQYVMTMEPETNVIMIDGKDIAAAEPFMMYAHVDTFAMIYDMLPVAHCIVPTDINRENKITAAEAVTIYDDESDSRRIPVTVFKFEKDAPVADNEYCIRLYLFLTELLNENPAIKELITAALERKMAREMAEQRRKNSSSIRSLLSRGCFSSIHEVGGSKSIINYHDQDTRFSMTVQSIMLRSIAENMKHAITATIVAADKNGRICIELIVDGPEFVRIPIESAEMTRFTLSDRDCKAFSDYIERLDIQALRRVDL